MRIRIHFVLMICLAPFGDLLAQVETATREHSSITARDGGAVLYRMTRISRGSELQESEMFLIEDVESEEQLVLTADVSYHHSESLWRIVDPESGQELTLRSELPLQSRTRTEALAEFRAMSADDLRSRPPGWSFLEVAGSRYPIDADEWRDPLAARKWRSEIRALINPGLLASLERLRIIATRETRLNPFCDLLSRVLYHVKCDEGLVVNTIAPPDCSYDAAFGYPCSRAQRKRVEQAEADGVQLHRY